MTDETISEIVKAFAYGKTAEEVAEVEGMTDEEVAAFQTEHADDIKEREALLQEEGWI